MREITQPVALCLEDRPGRLNPDAVGWSRHPLQRCNLAGAWPRKKRWNYWAFTTDSHLFSVTVSNIDYVGLAFVYVADFEARTLHEETVLAPLGAGCDLAETVDHDVTFERSGLRIAMRQGEDAGLHCVRFDVDMPRFAGRGLTAELVATTPAGHESLNVVIPWSERRYQFTSKQNTLPARGTATLGAGASADTIRFEGEQAFACLDYGRGVWPYRSTWNWGAGSGRRDGRTLGLNLGGRWTDGTGQTENGVCIDGRLVKCHDDLVWSYDPDDWLKPWRVRSPDAARSIDLEFTPMLERVARTNALVVRSVVHQLFGHWHGSVRDELGRGVPVDGIVGWAEEHRAAW